MNSTRYASTIARIQAGQMSRDELQQLGRNARARADAGDVDAHEVLAALKHARCVELEYVFLGFCPNARLDERLDLQWREAGHCSFDFLENKVLTERFLRITPGDLLILKKRQDIGKTMRLYGHGRAASTPRQQGGILIVDVDWSAQDQVIEVPLMGCNTTIDVRSLDALRQHAMPEAFYDWLRDEAAVKSAA